MTATGADRTLALLEAQVGRPLAEVETPVAVIDLDRLEANLADLQSYADTNGIALWPHTKTHKSPEIGLRQLELGAAGLTVAKTGEAQVFHEAGAPRILVHYPPFGAAKWERLADIAAAGVELTVVVDSVAPAEGLARVLDRRGLDGRGPRRARRRPAPNRPDDRRRSARRCGAALEAPRARGRRASAATRATAAATIPPGSTTGRGRCAPARDPRRVHRARAALRPHLGRLDTDAPSDAHDLRERAALRDVCAPRPERSRDRAAARSGSR